MVEKMRIAISTLSGISYGSATYFKNLLRTLAKLDKENEYHIFIGKDNMLYNTIDQDNFVFHICRFNTNLAFLRHFWEQFILPIWLRKNRTDIVFTAKNGNILFAPCKTVISIRNVEPLFYKKYKNYWKLNMFSLLRLKFTDMSIKKADRVIAVSNTTKKRLEDHFSAVRGKVDVIYNGNPVNGNGKPVREGCNNEDRPRYLLSASKFVTYANQYNLINGYALLIKEEHDLPPLWLVGGILDHEYFKKVESLIYEKNLRGKIKIIGLVSHERLIQLYSGAFGFLFPSTLEACPHTLIEAMACGIPIAASNVPPMPEICEDAAIYFDPFNARDIADRIKLILTDTYLRDRLRKKSLERSRFFDWDKTAVELIRVFSTTVNGVPKPMADIKGNRFI